MRDAEGRERGKDRRERERQRQMEGERVPGPCRGLSALASSPRRKARALPRNPTQVSGVPVTLIRLPAPQAGSLPDVTGDGRDEWVKVAAGDHI